MLKIATKFAPDSTGFELAWSSGFRYAEFFLNSKILENVSEIVSLGKQYPLEYVPHFPNKNVNKKTVDRVARIYEELNCRSMVIHQPMIDEWGDEIRERLPKVRLAVENHYLKPKEFWKWAENNPGLNLDVEHLWKFTLDSGPVSDLVSMLDEFLDQFFDKLNHVHLPGYTPGSDEHRPMYCSRELMEIVWPRLQKRGYDFFMVSEINTSYQTAEDLKMDLLLFQGWWKRVGHKLEKSSK